MKIKKGQEIFICQDCKHKKLEQIGVPMTVGSIPVYIRKCDLCKKVEELYSYKEREVQDEY